MILCLCLHFCQPPVTVNRIGPQILSVGTLGPDKSTAIPTVTDNLFQQGKISQNLVALFFEPMNGTSVENGEMTFGDTDSSKYTGDITYL